MKFANKRRIFYPIRAVMLLLIFSLLLTGCGIASLPDGAIPDGPAADDRPSSWEDFGGKEFYNQSFDGADASCGAVRSDTNVLDLDDVTLSFHFGIYKFDEEKLEKLSSGKRVDIYFKVSDEDWRPIYHLAEQMDISDERLASWFCLPRDHGSKDEHNPVWFSGTVPRELLLQGEKKVACKVKLF